MYAVSWKALRTFSRFCLPILLIFSVTPLHGATDAAWEMLESEHFQIYYQSDETHPQDIADIAEDFYPQINRLIDGIEIAKIEIWMCKTQQQFQAAAHAPIQDWAVGCAFPLSRRIVIQNPRVIIDRKFQLSQVLRHEIVHIAFGQRTKSTIGEIPLWFIEGIAIYLSGEWAPHRHEVMFEAYPVEIDYSAYGPSESVSNPRKESAVGLCREFERGRVAGKNRRGRKVVGGY